MEESRALNFVLTAAIGALGIVPCAVLAELLRRAGVDVPYLCFLVGIVACCAFGGWALAAWALVFSALGLWYFFLPPSGFGWPEYSDAAHLIVFIGVSFFACSIIDGQRRANDELTRDNVVLGCKLSSLLKRAKAR